MIVTALLILTALQGITVALVAVGTLNIIDKLDALRRLASQVHQDVELLELQGRRLMATLQEVADTLRDEVARNTSLKDSILTALAGNTQQIADLTAKLAAAGVDPAIIAELQATVDAQRANNDALAVAIPQGTPAAPTP